jgi:hypothetical protein
MSQVRITGLQKAIKCAGDTAALADKLGVKRRTIVRWLHDEGVSSVPDARYPDNAVTETVLANGGPAAVSRDLGVTYQAVVNWMHQGWAPSARAAHMGQLYKVDCKSMLSPKLRDAMGSR